MKKYEGMFIFYPNVDGAALEERINAVSAEIVKLGGQVRGVTRMGRNAFARKLRKQESGVYVLLNFLLDPGQVDALNKRYRLHEEILRVRIMSANEQAASAAPAPAAAPAG